MEKISIIVPVYGVEPYLRQCVDSILGQTYQNLEVILVDDGSPDNCGKICDSYAVQDSRVKVIHKENGGLSDARNHGLSRATGKMICFVDSDDYVAPEYCELMYKTMQQHNCDIVECNAIKFQDGENPQMTGIGSIAILHPKQWLTESGLGEMLTCVVWNKLYKRNIVDGILFPVGRKFEDEATTYRYVYKANKIVRISSGLYFYRQRTGSITNQRVSQQEIDHKCIALKERYLFFEQEQHWDIAAFAKAKYCILRIGCYKNMNKLSKDGQSLKDTYKEIKGLFAHIYASKAVPLKYKVYILAFLMIPVAFRYV